MQDRRSAEARLMRNFYLKTGLKVAAVLVVVFVLSRIWGPNLINRHEDLALAAGIACYVAALAVICWLTVQIGVDRRALNLAKADIHSDQP